MDLKMDTNYDLLFENGDIPLVTGIEAIAQHLGMRLRTWLGESPYDLNSGTPWLQAIFSPQNAQTVNAQTVEFILEQRCLSTPGILTAKVDCVLDRETRTINGTGSCTATQGEILFTLSLSGNAVIVETTP